ncbi:MAG: FHA domain-containing protein [Limisphaerales bacterium]
MRIYYTYHGQQQVRDVDRKEILIGRLSPLSAPDIDLGDDPTVSRKHCRIKMTTSGCVIEDLRSTNGTVVNNDFVDTASVDDSSPIRLGETDIKIELQPQGEPTLQPVPSATPAGQQAAAAPQSPVAKPQVAKADPMNPPASPKPSDILPPKGQKPGAKPAPEAAKPEGAAGILPSGGPGSKPKAASPAPTPAPAQKPVPKPEVKKEAPQPVSPPSKAKAAKPANEGAKPTPPSKPKAPAAIANEGAELKASVPSKPPEKPGTPSKPKAKSASAKQPAPSKKETPQPTPATTADPKADSKFRHSLAELFEVPLSFTPELKLEQMLSLVLERVLKLIPGAEHGAILINDAADKKLVVKASKPEGKVVVSDTLARRVMEEGHGFILERNLEGGSSLNPKLVKVETGMYAPLLSKEKPLGAIFVDDPERSNPYGEEDMQFLLAVSHYVATIVRNHELQSGLVHNSTMLDRVVPKFPAKIQDALLNELQDNKLRPAGRKDDLPVLFAELQGFEAAGTELPAEAATEMMSEYYGVLQNALFKYDGSLERFSGAGMVALFGAPLADEKANEKAVVAAISMRDAVRDLNLKRVQNGGNIWHLRVGVNLGTVFHGFVGTDERMNFSVVGPGMTRAKGFCRGAENGEVLIGPELYQKVFKIVEADRSTVSHKDFGEFHCYRVKGLKQK